MSQRNTVNNGLQTLIIDSHPMIVWSYESLLKKHVAFINPDTFISKAFSCEDAYHELTNASVPYSIIILEINTPGFLEKSFTKGEDLGIYIKSKWPKTKFLITTTILKIPRLINIISSIQPNGLLVKSDITPTCFINAIDSILRNEYYYSSSLTRLKLHRPNSEESITILDRKILYYISIGEKTKNLSRHLPLSISSIERRKRNLKIVLKATCDRELIREAKKRGLI